MGCSTDPWCFMRRILLFLATNLAVLVVLGTVMSLLEPWLVSRGINVHYAGILIMALLFGMGGAVISLLLSKRLAVASTRARIIAQPANEVEQWLVDTVARQAREAGIGMPDVAVYQADRKSGV